MRLLAAAIFAFSAIAPSALSAAQTPPLRVLVYRFSIDEHAFGTYQGSGYVNGHGVSRTATSSATLGASGTITVNVLRAAGDGGLVIDAIEHVDHADRDQQAIRCAVYGSPQGVFCDQNLVAAGEQTNEVTAVLMYMGRGFYNSSLLDAKRHWQTTVEFNDGHGQVTCDYIVTKADGPLVDIALSRVLRDGPYETTTTGTVVYDPSMTIPRNAHLVTTGAGGSSDLHGSTIDFQLLSDSFTKH
jgi:hypothetical protein